MTTATTGARGVTHSIANEIVEFINGRIAQGAFRSGDRLPTELQLARQFQVSRPVVREAISQLKADGLVRSLRGSGLYVQNLSDKKSFKVDINHAFDPNVVLQLLELRQPVEVSAARLAAARRSEEDLANLHAAHDAMLASEDWSEEGVTADIMFHQSIAAACHNGFYVDFLAYLGGLLRESIRVARSASHDPKVKQVTINEHQRILAAIQFQDPERAAFAMMAHIDGARDRMTRADRLSSGGMPSAGVSTAF